MRFHPSAWAGVLARWSAPTRQQPAAITSAHLVPLVRAGATFDNGVLVERQDQAA
ncbi:hypothetical protein [Kitasatospora azatica]|uniref:hypothetical protein n=1 Tax=Kitasatospora azatica TaxID=58347 RepID=UPI0012FCB609|nr:hypothetical protein [Kitasatospora azatica]